MSNELPVARDDSDALAAGTRGPATGNVISGDGTQTGSIGADLPANGAKITELEGAGGTDSTFAGGRLSVTGEHGQLTLDAQGNYSYLANKGAPETARDHFTYKLADSVGNSDTARLTIEIGKTQSLGESQQVVPGPDGVVVLPAGVELSDIHVVGRNLVIDLPDGTQMVIVDGAVFVPQLVINDVEIPATNLAALLIDGEPQPAAGGQPPSSGGNFALPPPPLDPGVPLGDLIPPTELDYTPPDIIPVGIDEEDPNEPPFATNDDINVSDEGLEGGKTDEVGTPDTTDSATANGSILAGDEDGDDLTITLGIPAQTLESHDVELEWVLSAGNTVLTGFAGEDAVIVVTMNANGTYTVVQSAPIDHPNAAIEDGVSFVIPVNVSDGEDAVDVTITVTIEDDSPVATNVQVGDSLFLDETDGGEPVSSGAPLVATSDEAMVEADVDYGADGQGGDPVYGLSLLGTSTVGSSIASGLATADGDHAITLTLTSATLITATYDDGGTQTAFTIQMNADGTVTVTQFTALEHLDDGPPGPDHDDALNLLNGTGQSLVNATVTYEDFDGDTTAGSAGIGGAITFRDDGPSIDVTEGSDANVVLVTDDADTEGTDTDSDSTSANFGGVFGIGANSGGGDGAATPDLTFTLGHVAGASGLFSHGVAINLYNVGGVIVGSTALVAPATATDASVVFSVSVNGDGEVTLNQLQQIDHPAADDPDGTDAPFSDHTISLADAKITLTASATITDNDGDTASDSETVEIGANLVFTDDGPTVSEPSVGDSVLLDETDGANPVSSGAPIVVSSDEAMISAPVDYGADGEGPDPLYGLSLLGTSTVGDSVASNLETADGNHAITLTLTSATLITATYEDGGTQTAFTIQMNADGTITVSQFTALEHLEDGPPGPDHDDALNLLDGELQSLVNATVTYEDFDGDTATAEVGIGGAIVFEDDGPSIDVTETVPTGGAPLAALDLVTGDNGTEGPGFTQDSTTADFGGVFGLTFDGGGDGAAATPDIDYSVGLLVAGGTNSGLESHDVAIKLYNVGGVIVGSTALVAPATATDASVVFSIAIDANGVVTLTQYQQIDHPDEAPGATNAPFADQLVVLGAGLVEVIASGTITDLDGDTDTDEERLDIGNFVKFADDGPAITDVRAGSSVLLDETDGGEPLSSGAPIVVTSEDPMLAAAVDYGADGQGPDPIFGLSLLGTSTIGASIASGLETADGNHDITLTLTSATLITATYQDGGTQTAFTIEMNLDGTITVTQFTALEHLEDGPPGPDHDDALNLLNGQGQSLVNATVTYEDFDGDTATASVGIGGSITFEDDGPTVSETSVGDSVVLDETDGGEPVSAGAPIVVSSDEPMIVSDVNYGADGQGADPIYGLSLVNGAAIGTTVASGLMTSAGNFPITLTLTSATLITATYVSGGTQTAFTIEMNADGTITVTQNTALEHLDPLDHDDALDLVNGLSNLVNATVTYEDADGDTVTASVGIGGAITFRDDGPSVDVTEGSDANVVLITDDADTEGTDSDSDSTSADFGGVFGIGAGSVGGDGATVTPDLSYALGFQAGASGLFSHGVAINLYNVGGVIVGSTALVAPATADAASVVFAVSVDANGVVTLTQHQQIDHPAADDPDGTDAPFADHTISLADAKITLTASATITDNDGDTDSDSETVDIGANLVFTDDGPTVTEADVNSSVVLDETDGGEPVSAGAPIVVSSDAPMIVSDVDYGADGEGPDPVYGLSLVNGAAIGTTVASGLMTSAGNFPITLTLTSATLITATYVSGGTQTAFTIEMNADGTITVTQNTALEHLDPLDHDDALDLINGVSNLVNATVTYEDFDGDTATASVGIGGAITFRDDGPSIDVTEGSDANVVLITDDADTIGTDSDSDSTSADFGNVFGFTSNVGGDGAAATPDLNYALGFQAGPSGLFSQGVAINLYNVGGVIVGSTALVAPATADAASVVFAVSVDANGVVTLTQHQQIDHPAADDPDGTDAPFADHTISLADAKITLTASATITDNDGDTDSDSETVDIGANLTFTDDGPEITAVDTTLDIDNDADPSGFGDFAYSIGADFNSDFDDITVSNFTVSVNGVLITDPADFELVPGVENADAANYTFSFTYADTPTTTATAEGTLVFHKTGDNAGQYEVQLTNGPISAFSTLSVQQGEDPIFHDRDVNNDGDTTDGVDVDNGVAVVELADDFFIQFTGASGVTGSAGTFGHDETFGGGSPGEVKISSTAIGVFGNSVQDDDVLDYNFYATNPGANEDNPPTTSAATAFIQVTQFNGAEDFIVVLKLADPASPGTFITRTLVIEPGDVITTDVPGYPALENGEGLIIIEPNDYINLTGVPDNYEIVGMQLRSSTEGLQSEPNEVYNFEGDLGAFDNSTTVFGPSGGGDQGTNDNDVFKILDIGVVRASTEDQNATLNFDVTVEDFDGDTATTNITVNIGDPPADALMASTMESSSRSMEGFSSTSLMASDSDAQLQKTAANNNNVVLAAALAAAGVAAAPAAAQTQTQASGDQSATIAAAGLGDQSAPADSDVDASSSTSRLLSGNESRVAADDSDAGSSASFADTQVSRTMTDEADAADAPTELLEATDSGSDAAAASPIAPMVVMPSAEALESMAGDAKGGSQRSETVEKVLAEALEGGAGEGDIDALLATLTGGGNGDNAALDALASPDGGAVPGWDMGPGGHLPTTALMNIVTEAAALHHDAVQPAING